MMPSVAEDGVEVPGSRQSNGADLVARASAGARLMTVRGVAMRVISVASNLLLLALVVPVELGIFAVVFGIAGILHFSADLGFERALMRRRQEPTVEEYAALSAIQLVVVSAAVLAGLLWPKLALGFGALDDRWHVWMLLMIASMASLAAGTGARIRLERRLEYPKLAVVDVGQVVLQNVGLVTFALLDRFALGTFIVLGLTQVILNAALFLWSPGPLPSLRGVARLLPLARGSAGYMSSNWAKIAAERATPVIIANLFGLGLAGIWSFSFRLAQLLNVTFEGFRRAAVPAAALLAHDRANLRRLATNTLRGTVRAAAPIAGLAFVTAPVLGILWPQWKDAVVLAQVSVIFFALAGVAGATLEPVAVTLRGARAAVGERISNLVVCWAGLLLLAWTGGTQLAWIVAPSYLAPVVVLLLVTDRDVRPAWNPDLNRSLLSLATGLGIYAFGRLTGLSVLVVAPLAAAGILIWLRPSRLLHGMRQLRRLGTQLAGGRP